MKCGELQKILKKVKVVMSEQSLSKPRISFDGKRLIACNGTVYISLPFEGDISSCIVDYKTISSIINGISQVKKIKMYTKSEMLIIKAGMSTFKIPLVTGEEIATFNAMVDSIKKKKTEKTIMMTGSAWSLLDKMLPYSVPKFGTMYPSGVYVYKGNFITHNGVVGMIAGADVSKSERFFIPHIFCKAVMGAYEDEGVPSAKIGIGDDVMSFKKSDIVILSTLVKDLNISTFELIGDIVKHAKKISKNGKNAIQINDKFKREVGYMDLVLAQESSEYDRVGTVSIENGKAVFTVDSAQCNYHGVLKVENKSAKWDAKFHVSLALPLINDCNRVTLVKYEKINVLYLNNESFDIVVATIKDREGEKE